MKEQTQVDAADQRRTRRLAWAATTMFLLSVGIFAGFSSLRNKNLRPQPHDWMIPDISVAQKQQIIDKAQFLRDKWRPWALAHQADLQRMLNASASDAVACETVWQKLPSNSDNVGITSRDLMPTGDPTVGFGFGWAPISKPFENPSPAVKASQDKDLRELEREHPGARDITLNTWKGAPYKRRIDFRKQRDIVISICAKGRTWTYLWASGRITQKVRVSPEARREVFRKFRAQHRDVNESDLFGPTRQVAAPYDFLTQPATF